MKPADNNMTMAMLMEQNPYTCELHNLNTGRILYFMPSRPLAPDGLWAVDENKGEMRIKAFASSSMFEALTYFIQGEKTSDQAA